MPLPFAPLVGLALGALFAWLARAELARADEPLASSRAFAIVGGYAALVYAPVVGYFVLAHGDWAWLYTVASRSIPSAVDLALVLVAGASVPAGFAAAARAARTKRLGVVGAVGGVPVAVVALMVVVLERRLATSGTTAQFRGGFGTEPITQSLLGPAILWMDLLAAAGAAWCGWSFRAK